MAAGLAPFSAMPAAAAAVVPAPECATEVEAEAAALEMAKACGQTVEVLSERTPWDTVTAQPSGELTWTAGAVATRAKVGGSWRPVDATVVAGPKGVSPVAAVLPMTFSPGGAQAPLARIEHEGRALEVFWPLGALPQPSVSGRAVTYASVLPDVDLVVTVDEDATGFSEVLVVHTPEAAANPALAELSFPVQTSGGLSVAERDGGLAAVDGTGVEVFASPTPIMWDSSGSAVGGAQTMAMTGEPDAADDRAVSPLEGDQVAAMPVEVSAGTITITPDQTMLDDAGTSWPVYIDPSWDAGEGVAKYEWQLIAEAWPTERSTGAYYKFTNPEGVGLCSTSSDSSCVSTGRKRLIWEFTVPAAIHGSVVSSAEFSAYKTSQWSCGDTGWTRLYRTNSVTSTTTWNTHHAHWDNGTTQDALILDSHGPVACTGWDHWDATTGAQLAAANSWTSLTLGLRATTETAMANNWRKFRNDATLSITFNRYPNTPGDPVLDMSQAVGSGPSGYVTRDATPQLSATVSDPDGVYGDTVRGLFQVYDGSTKVWEDETVLAASGSTFSISTGTLSQNILYTVRVWGKDSAGLVSKAWSNSIEFKVDVTAPGVPGVVAQNVGTGVDAKYSENSWAGGIGKVGKFQFTPAAGVTDTDKYRYSFDSTTYTSEVDADAAGNSASLVSYTPSAPGLHILRVWAVDNAGWVGSAKVYNFYVYAAAKAAWWKLDGNGTDSVSGNANPVTTTGTVSWVPGPVGYVNDQALHSPDTTTYATTAGPVLHTTGSYTVTAYVNPSNASGSSVAVSQDGVNASGFRLGILDSGCQVGTRCWGIWVAANDSATSPGWTLTTPATAGFEVQQDTWTALAAVYDATAHEFRLYVNGELAGTKSFTATWDAVGKLRIGDSVLGGASDLSWYGDIDDVRVYKAALDEATIRRVYAGSQAPGDIPQ